MQSTGLLHTRLKITRRNETAVSYFIDVRDTEGLVKAPRLYRIFSISLRLKLVSIYTQINQFFLDILNTEKIVGFFI